MNNLILKFSKDFHIKKYVDKEDDKGSLKSLVRSIWKVKSKYLIYTNNEGDIIEGLERVFAYELYRQWANYIARNSKLRRFTINGESFKSSKVFYNNLKKGTFPDMVMHSGDGNTNMQEIVCEIKREKGIDKDSFLEDIKKLWTFTSFNNPFKFGVFILVGKDLDFLVKQYIDIEKLRLKLDSFDIEKTNNIICISYINDKNGIKQMELCRLPILIHMSQNQ